MTARLLLRRCHTTARRFSTSMRRRAILGDGDAAAFDEHVIKGNKLVFVDFHADWCPPCKMLNPVLQRVFQAETGADLMKINTDNEQDIAAKYKVSALPTVIAFKHGKEYSRFVGLVDEEAVKTFLANAKED